MNEGVLFFFICQPFVFYKIFALTFKAISRSHMNHKFSTNEDLFVTAFCINKSYRREVSHSFRIYSVVTLTFLSRNVSECDKHAAFVDLRGRGIFVSKYAVQGGLFSIINMSFLKSYK